MTSLAVRWRTDPREALGELADRLAFLAFAILIVASPMGARFNLDRREVESVPPVYTDLLLPWTYVGILGILGLWAVSLICRPRSIDIGPRFVWMPVVGLLVVAVLGIPGSIDPTLTAFNVARLLVVVAIGVYVVNQIDGLERLAVPIMLMIGVEVAVGLSQVINQRSIGLTWLSEARMGVNAPNSSVIGAADGSRWLRAYGLAAHPNILGGVLAFAMLLLAAAQGAGRSRVVRLAVLGLGAALLFLTFSRGAWIAFAVGAAIAMVMLALRGDRGGVRRWAAAVLVVACVSVLMAIPFMAQLGARTTLSGPVPTEVRSIDERLALNDVTFAVVRDHALLGTGLGMLPLVLPEREPDFAFAYQPAHLVVLDAAAETGILGLAFYLALVIGPWVALVRVRSRWTRSLVGASAAWAAVTVVGLFDFYTWGPSAGRTWAWIVLGLWVVTYRDALGQRRPGAESLDP